VRNALGLRIFGENLKIISLRRADPTDSGEREVCAAKVRNAIALRIFILKL
jgi:hypothetical protein